MLIEAPFWDRVIFAPPIRTAVPVDMFEYPAPADVELPPIDTAAAFAPIEIVDALTDSDALPVADRLDVTGTDSWIEPLEKPTV